MRVVMGVASGCWRIGVSAVLVCAVAVLFLLSPRPNELRGRFCVSNVEISPRLGFPLNCDSPLFMRMARHPGALLAPGNRRQSRPLFVLSGFVLSKPLAPLFRTRPGKGIRQPAYAAFIIMNFLTLLVAVVIFQWLAAGHRWDPGVFALSSVLVANDVVKAFFWSPHTQMFNVLAPLTAMAFARQVLVYPAAPPGRLAAFGLAGGLLVLYYGSFLVLLPSMLLALALGQWQGRPRRTRLAAQAGALLLGFCVAPVAWWATVTVAAGAFYSWEVVRYRQFVWILDAWGAGGGELGRRLGIYLGLFLSLCLRVCWLPALACAGAAVAARVCGVRSADVLRSGGPTLLAAAIVLAVMVPFYALLGYYAARLTWNLVPPVLVVAGVLVAVVGERSTGLRVAAVTGLIVASVAAWLTYEVVKVGPYS